MNKWILLVGTCFLCLGSAYTLPIAFHNPTSTNVLISGLITAFAVVGLVMFFRPSQKNVKVEGMTPVRD